MEKISGLKKRLARIESFKITNNRFRIETDHAVQFVISEYNAVSESARKMEARQHLVLGLSITIAIAGFLFIGEVGSMPIETDVGSSLNSNNISTIQSAYFIIALLQSLIALNYLTYLISYREHVDYIDQLSDNLKTSLADDKIQNLFLDWENYARRLHNKKLNKVLIFSTRAPNLIIPLFIACLCLLNGHKFELQNINMRSFFWIDFAFFTYALILSLVVMIKLFREWK